MQKIEKNIRNENEFIVNWVNQQKLAYKFYKKITKVYTKRIYVL